MNSNSIEYLIHHSVMKIYLILQFYRLLKIQIIGFKNSNNFDFGNYQLNLNLELTLAVFVLVKPVQVKLTHFLDRKIVKEFV
jgi:hypothetical protein